jgi:hypothetical protein
VPFGNRANVIVDLLEHCPGVAVVHSTRPPNGRLSGRSLRSCV